VKSKSGKKLLRKRGEHVERSFVHVLDHGGMRRATIRGRDNLSKRHQVAAMGYNLSIFMRKCFGIGTQSSGWRRLLPFWRGYLTESEATGPHYRHFGTGI